MKMSTQKDGKLKIPCVENDFNSSLRLSIVRRSSKRSRTSILPQLSLDINSVDNSYDVQVNEDEQTDALAGYVLNSLWNICRVSPLHNLEYSPSKLKQFATKITQYLAGSIKSATTVHYKTEIKVIPNLKLEIGHYDALQIVVRSSNFNDVNNAKQIYSGILFSWGLFASKIEKNVVHLPLLIDNGRGTVAALVRQTLMKLFDCVIKPMSFSQSELLLFSALLSSFAPNDGTKFVNFIYNIPFTRSPTKLDVSMSADDIHNMWLSCFPNKSDVNMHNEESSLKWYSVFRKHIGYVYEMDISRLELTNLKYPNVYIQSKGKIQLKDHEAAKNILKILCEISVILKGSMPKLAFEYD